MESKRMTLQGIEGYIGGKEGLRKALQSDYYSHRFIREADLEVCTYHHLRKFLEPDKRWRIFARAYAKGLGRFPDITILEGEVRRLAIELKWRRKKISNKDRDTLNKILSSRRARKVYFITTVTNKSDYKKLGLKKREGERNKLKEIAISLDLTPSRLDVWKAGRQSIKESLR